jgi:hypothetical protein
MFRQEGAEEIGKCKNKLSFEELSYSCISQAREDMQVQLRPRHLPSICVLNTHREQQIHHANHGRPDTRLCLKLRVESVPLKHIESLRAGFKVPRDVAHSLAQSVRTTIRDTPSQICEATCKNAITRQLERALAHATHNIPCTIGAGCHD